MLSRIMQNLSCSTRMRRLQGTLLSIGPSTRRLGETADCADRTHFPPLYSAPSCAGRTACWTSVPTSRRSETSTARPRRKSSSHAFGTAALSLASPASVVVRYWSYLYQRTQMQETVNHSFRNVYRFPTHECRTTTSRDDATARKKLAVLDQWPIGPSRDRALSALSEGPHRRPGAHRTLMRALSLSYLIRSAGSVGSVHLPQSRCLPSLMIGVTGCSRQLLPMLRTV
ncbi:hypothetical protein C8F01DRAFT_469156 [Mycena amicta]|nr:hypothetical protein C8F01DRAFT_469156 [Mycena amicta]